MVPKRRVVRQLPFARLVEKPLREVQPLGVEAAVDKGDDVPARAAGDVQRRLRVGVEPLLEEGDVQVGQRLEKAPGRPSAVRTNVTNEAITPLGPRFARVPLLAGHFVRRSQFRGLAAVGLANRRRVPA